MENIAMPELRWTLLLLGVLFLVGLAVWESRRGRRAREADLARLASTAPAPQQREAGRDAGWDAVGDGEAQDAPLPSFSARDPEREPSSRPLPVYELPVREAPAPGRRLDPILDFAGEPMLADITEPVISDSGMDDIGLDAAASPQAAHPAAATGPASVLAPHAAAVDDVELDDFEVGAARMIEPPTLAPSQPAVETAQPVVDWPDVAQSRIVAVRILAPREKFQGRAVRLALTAQGFVLGKFSIYHKPAHDGRALLSVASLTKPGTFDAARVDLQRFNGLSLFTVLPGPLPAADAVDELLHCAGILSARLHGELRDEQGEPLSGSRAALLRAAASGVAATGPASAP